jgi:hypothetical protein
LKSAHRRRFHSQFRSGRARSPPPCRARQGEHWNVRRSFANASGRARIRLTLSQRRMRRGAHIAPARPEIDAAILKRQALRLYGRCRLLRFAQRLRRFREHVLICASKCSNHSSAALGPALHLDAIAFISQRRERHARLLASARRAAPTATGSSASALRRTHPAQRATPRRSRSRHRPCPAAPRARRSCALPTPTACRRSRLREN